MNPFVKMDTAITKEQAQKESLPLLKEYAWDFQGDHFLYNTDGSHRIVTENDALKVWIYKTLKTERYRHEAYKHGITDSDAPYGVELESFIGRANSGENAQIIKQYIYDGLIVNPYIVRIDDISIESRTHDKLAVSVSLTSVYGTAETEVVI